MARKALSKERKLSARKKNLNLTLPELKREIDVAGGDLRIPISLTRKESIRLIIRCKNRSVPEAWAAAMLYQNVRFDCIDYHRTDYTDADGAIRIGWHRDANGTKPNSAETLPSVV